jgi:hypothetical protein
MSRSLLAAAVSGVSPLSFPRRRNVLDLLVDVLAEVQGATCEVGAGARLASGAATGTTGAAAIWTLMLDSVELVPVGELNDGDADKPGGGGLNTFPRLATLRA